MAASHKDAYNLRLGYWVSTSVYAYGTNQSDALSMSDSIAYRVLVKLSDAIGLKDTNPARASIADVIVFFEELSARVKGKIQTLFISDDRYFRKRG
jgi:hypothetical protein